MFELQIRHFQNSHGLLQTGDCCDLQASGGQRCSARDQCDTFFQACLKEYQARVAPTGPCTFGSGSTGILGGNSQSLHHRGHDVGGEDGSNGHIVIPFKYAWPVSTGVAGYLYGYQGNRLSFKYNNTLELRIEWNNNDIGVIVQIHMFSHLLFPPLCVGKNTGGQDDMESNNKTQNSSAWWITSLIIHFLCHYYSISTFRLGKDIWKWKWQWWVTSLETKRWH